MNSQDAIKIIASLFHAAANFYDDNEDIQRIFPDRNKFLNGLLDPPVKHIVVDLLEIKDAASTQTVYDTYQKMFLENKL